MPLVVPIVPDEDGTFPSRDFLHSRTPLHRPRRSGTCRPQMLPLSLTKALPMLDRHCSRSPARSSRRRRPTTAGFRLSPRIWTISDVQIAEERMGKQWSVPRIGLFAFPITHLRKRRHPSRGMPARSGSSARSRMEMASEWYEPIEGARELWQHGSLETL